MRNGIRSSLHPCLFAGKNRSEAADAWPIRSQRHRLGGDLAMKRWQFGKRPVCLSAAQLGSDEHYNVASTADT